jgi:outer membrane protein OmpA-like peptidoglycan-associated protein/tetratricopeptide (TPR) repeat protein
MKQTLLALLLCLYFPLLSQDEEGDKKYCKEIDKSLEKLYLKGTDKKTPKPERLKYLKQALDQDPDFAEANLRMGFEMIVHLKLENKSFAAARSYFMKAIANCPDIHSEPYYYIGFGYYEEYKNDSAIKYLNKFIKFTSADEKKFGKDYEAELYNAKEMVKEAKQENELSKLTVAFDPKLVPGVSSERDEYLAYISPDDKNCFFVRVMPVNNKNLVYQTDREQEVFMRSRKDNTGMFDKGEEMPFPFNVTSDNQGGCTITMDNKYMYFAMMRDEGGAQKNCDIYVSKNVEDEWKAFSKVPFNDAKYWDSQPTVSADGNTIIFASDRPGGFGGVDLYQSVKDPKTGVWGPAINLGPKVNTPGHEKTPFIHMDSKTLYFCSGPLKEGGGGHLGFGGYDIFYVRKNEKGEWGEPKNIGKPINGPGDDTGFFVSTDAQTGYFVSFAGEKVSTNKSAGRYDLYSFPLYEEARPEEMALTGGKAVDENKEPIRGATIEVKELGTNKRIKALVDSSSGEFMFAVNARKVDKVVVSVKKEGMVYNSAVVDVKKAVTAFNTPPKVKAPNPDETSSEPEKAVPIVIKMDSVKVGSSFVINDILYNSNSADLQEDSKKVLEEFAKYLKENPKMIIEIQGHTDNVGSASGNQALSANRAFTVKATLESFGINGERIKARGYGSSRPIADNSSETGRAKNRRTEFLIIEN